MRTLERLQPWSLPLAAVILGLTSMQSVDPSIRVVGLSPMEKEILSHMQIVQLADGQGGAAKTIRITGVNVQIVNGLGATNGNPADPASLFDVFTNGVGNLIVGYNELGNTSLDDRTGSHNIVTGNRNSYQKVGAIVGGFENVCGVFNGIYNFVVGSQNRTDGYASTITGGTGNVASGGYSTVSGGTQNVVTENGLHGWMGGGQSSIVDGQASIVVGGLGHYTDGFWTALIGGQQNIASASYGAVLGGRDNAVSGDHSLIAGGHDNGALGPWSTVTGGAFNTSIGLNCVVSGGTQNTAFGTSSSVSGGSLNTANGVAATVTGGYLNDADGDWSSISGGSFEATTDIDDWRAGSCYACDD